jgi:flagellar protein FliO/FliZ
MDVVRFDQMIGLLAFLAGLGVLWVLVLRHRHGLTARMTRGRRIRLVEATALGPADRAMILSVDGTDFLVLRLKGAAPLVRPLGTAKTEGEAA